jgi:signal transduction histidine kinase
VLGLVQICIVGLGLLLLLRLSMPPILPMFHREQAYVGRQLVPLLADPQALRQQTDLVRRELHTEVAIVGPQGVILESQPGLVAQCLQSPEPLEWDLCLRQEIALPGGERGQFYYQLEALPHPRFAWFLAIILLGVGLTSWLLARELEHPLSRLVRVAQQVGAGQLDARTGLDRADELGEVARSFDLMIGRIGQLLQAERELLANVSHELRTPLARMRVARDLAREGDPLIAQEILGEIGEDLEELERLVEDVLTTAQLDLGPGQASRAIPPLRCEMVDVRQQLVAKAVSRFQTAHPERPLQVSIEDDPAPIVADPILLRRVLDNLLENAHRHSEAPRRPVDLVVTARDYQLCVVVRDRGVGIAPDDLPHLFEPFFRTDRSRARSSGGLGLGLTLARRIAEAHGGSLTIESVLGQGTTATLSVPYG